MKNIFVTSVLLATALQANATVYTPANGSIYYGSDGYCSAVTLNYVGTPSTNSFGSGESYGSTSCKGLSGNDPDYDLNIGLFGDGLLNGDSKTPNTPPLFDSYEFAEWVDVNGDGILDKPGWIGLARVDGGNITYNEVGGVDLHPYIGVDNVNYGNIFDLTFTSANSWMSGDWRLQVNASALLAAKALLGNSYFDHLNIVLKGGTTGFISYNFDIEAIFATHNFLYSDDLTLFSNYTLGGTWSTQDLRHYEQICTGQGQNRVCVDDISKPSEQQALSHATFAAHDPLTAIPAPASLALLGLGLVGICLRRKV